MIVKPRWRVSIIGIYSYSLIRVLKVLSIFTAVIVHIAACKECNIYTGIGRYVYTAIYSIAGYIV